MSGYGTYVRAAALALGAALALLPGFGQGGALASTQAVRTADIDGIRLVAQEADGPLAAACVFVGVGSARESSGENGVTSLLNNLILSPYPAAGPSAILEIEGLGGTVEVETAPEYSCFRLTVPVKNLALALAALGGAMASPPLGEPSLRAEKRRLAGRFNKRLDTPVELGYRLFLQKTYPGSPYGLHPEGDPDSVKRLGLSDVSGWHADNFVRENILVSICADVDYKAAEKLVGSAFAGIAAGPRGGEVAPVHGTSAALNGTGSGPGARSTGSVALVGYKAPPAGSPDFAAVKLAEAVVAEGMGSRLFRSLRVDGKLAYSFGSLLPAMSSGSRLTFYVSARPGAIDDAARCITRSVDSLKDGDITDAELARAREMAAGALSLEGEGLVGRARRAGLAGMLGVGQGYWDELAGRLGKTNARDVVTAARKYLDGCTLVVLRPGGAGR